MFRKLTLALGATLAIGAAALIPTSASAHMHGHGHFHGHGWGVGIYAPVYVSGPDCYIVKRVVDTPLGLQVRRITVCN
jgi:predicted glutamine amidotransferase